MRRVTPAVALACLTASTFAQTIIMTQDDFQSNTVDALLPKAATSSHGAYAYAASPNDIYVRADPDDSGNKVAAVSTSGASGAYLYASALTGTIKTFNQLAAAGQSLQYNFDVYVGSSNLNQSYVSLQYGNSGNAVFGAVFFKTPSGGNSAIDYSVAGSTATSTGFSLSADAWYTMTYDVYQLENDNWAFSASMVNKSTHVSTVLFTDQVATITDTSVNSFLRVVSYQYGNAGNVNTTYIDNISLTIVPEPSVFALLGIGMLILLLTHRQRVEILGSIGMRK